MQKLIVKLRISTVRIKENQPTSPTCPRYLRSTQTPLLASLTSQHSQPDISMADKLLNHIASAAELDTLMSNNTYVVVDFYADWCGPCKAIAPSYANLSKQHSIPRVLAFAKVNVDNAQDAAARYRVSAMPTFMFFKEGKQVAVNGQAMIQGADPRSLSAAAEKLGGLAKKRAASA